jgi:hypothetical protein
MKKITLLFLLLSVFSVSEVFSQSDYYTAIPSDGSTSGNARAPHGRFRYERGVILITAAEMTDSGIASGDVINGIAFNYLIAQDVPTTATMTLYLQNTTDATNTKSTTWSTVIGGMTTVSSGAVTIPNTVGNATFPFAGGSPFTYTGDAVYVAFDYQNAANPLPGTFATVDCNSTGLVNGYKGAQSDVAAPATIAASSFRPVILLGKLVSCARPTNLQEDVALKTTTSVTGMWVGGSNTTIEYGPYGFTPGTGTVITNATSPYTISGLSPSTVYDVYLKNNCGTDIAPVYSATTAVDSFNTVFLPSDAPYNTGFEQEELAFIGWQESPVNFTSSWFIVSDVVGSPLVQEGIASAVSLSNTLDTSNAWLLSRGVNLTAGSDVTITYYDRNYLGTGSTGSASYEVTVGTDQLVDSQTTVLSTVTNLTSTAFALKTVNFTTPATGVYYFGFHNSSPVNAGTQALIIDNVTINQTLAVSEFLASKLNVYPNPANNVINFSNDVNATVNTIEVADLNGRTIKSIKVNATEGQISVGDLATGMYMMKFTTDQGTAVKKIVKE